jgi:hypothetical protein
MPSDPRIRTAMEQAAEAAGRIADVDEALHALTAGAVDAIQAADYASISIRRRDGTLETLAATDPLVEKLDRHQYELREGPCYDTATDETFAVSFDMARDRRWPRYGPIAAEFGVHGQLAVLLTENREGRSALNVYSGEPHEFDSDSVETAELFASHAAVAMGFVRAVTNLSAAVASRQTIGMALGVVMERYQLDSTRAFAFLVRTSQTSNVKLRDVSAQIVAGHDSRSRLQNGPESTS